MRFIIKLYLFPFYLIGRICSGKLWNILRYITDLSYASFLSGKLKNADGLIVSGRNVHLLGCENIDLGNNVTLGESCRIEAISMCRWGELHQDFSPKITIGDNVVVAPYCHIGCINRIEIGEYTTMGPSCLITDHTHGNTSFEHLTLPPRHRPLTSKGPVKIGRCVHMGERVVVLPGVTIGDHTVIGANAVVAHDVAPYSVVVGPYAKSIRQVDPQL